MKLTRVSSSVIDAIGYEDERATLTVVFRDGNVYEFHLVPRHVWEEFLAAKSKGAFFNEAFKEGAYGERRTRRI